MIKQAVISAGGFGTRLRPYTDTVPKPMLPVLGHPTLAWSVAHFKKHGVTEFFFTLHYLPQIVMDYFGDGSKFGVKIHYCIEREPLGEAGAIKQFELQLDRLFYYIYGDMLTLIDYTKMAAAYGEIAARDKKIVGMERVQRADDYANVDVAELDADNRFVATHVKPHSRQYPNAYRTRGSFILDKKILSFLPEGAASLNKHLIPAVIAAGNSFYGYECDDYSKGFDDLAKWHEVEAYLKKNNISFESI
jgi:NDP-sugar pyrophosphorylase family protein